jgi:hypothetical protein
MLSGETDTFGTICRLAGRRRASSRVASSPHAGWRAAARIADARYSIRSQSSVGRTATTIRRVNRILQINSDVSRIADARH